MLRSVAILHRHGSRGPGDSELNPWEEKDAIHKQWQHNEVEMLSSVGMNQMKSLGSWAATKYVNPAKSSAVTGSYRCSTKSDRARESGYFFVTSFNEGLSSPVMPVEPDEYEVSPDNYFRPWKVHKDLSKIIGQKKYGSEAVERANANKELLKKSYKALKSSMDPKTKLQECFWATTNVTGLLEVEAYWPHATAGQRTALIQRANPDMIQKFEQLSCWVWEERFIRSGFEPQMGGWLFLDMLQRCFNPEYHFNEFSGHDYTILSVLAAIGAVKTLEGACAFGCYLVLELWDATPPPHQPGAKGAAAGGSFITPVEAPEVPPSTLSAFISSVSAAIPSPLAMKSSSSSQPPQTPPPPSPSKRTKFTPQGDGKCDPGLFNLLAAALSTSWFPSAAVEDSAGAVFTDTRVLRLKFNRRPFDPEWDLLAARAVPAHGQALVVHDEREVLLVDYDMASLRALVDRLCQALVASGIGLPTSFVMPDF